VEQVRRAGAVPAGTQAWQWLDIREGLPTVTQPVQEEFVAQMLNFDLIGGVSFNKGCYPGQEIVARTHYLGKLKKRMYRAYRAARPRGGHRHLRPDFGDQSAGKVVSAAPAPEGGYDALVVLQSSSADAGQAHLGAPDGPALAFLPLPYALG
jgi:folate-binding protein YgfZ